MTIDKRVVIIAQGIDGGIAPLSSTLAQGLAGRGWSCAVRYVGRPAVSRCVAADRSHGVDSEVIITGKARSMREVAGLLLSEVAIWRFVRKYRPTHVIFAGFMPALTYGMILRHATDAKFLFWDHAPQDTFLRIKQVLFPPALRHMEHIVSISRSTAEAMKSYFGVDEGRLDIVPNGIDPQRWTVLAPAPAFPALRIIMPARLDLNQKDQLTLIQAIGLLEARGFDVRLTLVGSGVSEDRIRQEIAASPARDVIQLIGHSDDVPSLVADHNVVCLSTRFEGLPTVVIEALMAKRVVVASRVAGCVDVVEDGTNGFLFEAGDAQSCANALTSLLQIPRLDAWLERAQTRALALYTPLAMVTRFEELLLRDRPHA
jgi:glycosyltransferase involved in cell wall biosynthesis